MEITTVMAGKIKSIHQKDWYIFLSIQKFLVEKHFEWLKLSIDKNTKTLIGSGRLNIAGKDHSILISYSSFHKYRYERIFINDKSLKYNNDIHLYGDLSLCLYHPTIDQSIFRRLSLFEIIPWISEWIIFYEQWKKYGVWLGKEIKH